MSVVAEPAPGSVIEIANRCSPLAQPGRKRRFCSSLPSTAIARAGPWSPIWQMVVVLKHTRAISSTKRTLWIRGAPRPPYSGGMSSPNHPASARVRRFSSGKLLVLVPVRRLRREAALGERADLGAERFELGTQVEGGHPAGGGWRVTPP